jgi:hypothetical protein
MLVLTPAYADVQAPPVPGYFNVTAYPDAFNSSLVDVNLSWSSSVGASGYGLVVAQYPDVSALWNLDMGYSSSFQAELAYGTQLYLAVTAYRRDASGNAVESCLSKVMALRLISRTEIYVDEVAGPGLCLNGQQEETPPASGFEGDWMVTETINASAYGMGSFTEIYPVSVTVSGSNVSLYSPDTGARYSGNLTGDGSSASLSGSVTDPATGMTMYINAGVHLSGGIVYGSGNYSMTYQGMTLTLPTTFTANRR